VENENEAFVESHLGEAYDPDAVIDVRVNGQEYSMKAREALNLVLEVTDRVPLATIAGADGDEPLAESGDLLIHALFGECGEVTEVRSTPVPGLRLDPQFWLYEGGVIEGVASEDARYVNHLAKSEGSAAGLTFAGHGTSLCIPMIGWPGSIWLVVIDGTLHQPLTG